ncbi:ATP synthase subunit I [Pseudalkalibacillus hwajinpoensis]|uniref:ATP synthase subunit I n=1 Tax=Guptibacillus hwajinpoensis TaxID=208199 RepID=UPI001CD4E402|nr:ATP synthase subunit I [Pseudalkalibacillus hwajinpoensis]MCA0991224.1 ATP synthase subunit I [Pseudalkalibacillus hwajinpoensis]
MTEYTQSFRRYMQFTLYLLAIFVMGWGITSYKALFLGLILGTIFSIYNLFNMFRKIDRLGEATVKGTKARSLGLLTRQAVAGLSVLIALRYPEYFNLLGVVIGLMTTYIIILIDSTSKIRFK